MHVSDPSNARSRRPRLMMMSACAACALASSGVAAAQASALMISVSAPCVLNTSASLGSVPVVGVGFTPGDSIELTTTTGSALGTVRVAPNGDFQTSITAPSLSTDGPAVATLTLTAQDETTPLATMPSTTFNVANLAVATKPTEAKPDTKVTFTFSGFTSGAEVYGHYLHGKKIAATAKFGRATGACGTLKTKAKLYPSHQKYESYTVQFDDSSKYSATALPRLVEMLTVFKF